ncbi:hypothetical protein EPH_0032600 [Eimeria praecox]|uniref:Uncharacterized protein n=1 Tax=Eimeria praecox TaxID=51316 RepID=U6G6R0_9EIME|nr:hypothetical protein EPH_0032600 [Eimeria praecox]
MVADRMATGMSGDLSRSPAHLAKTLIPSKLIGAVEEEMAPDLGTGEVGTSAPPAAATEGAKKATKSSESTSIWTANLDCFRMWYKF